MKRALKFAAGLLALIVGGPVLIGLVLKWSASAVQPPGRLLDVGGYKLHIYCTGSPMGLPPVLIEAGLGLSSPFYHWIQASLEQTTRVCTYDRAGLGWSEESGRPRDPADIAEQLHILLDKSGFKRPFVLVGHSIGAIIVREYVARYPDDVAGLAFLDGSHPNQASVLGFDNAGQKAEAETGIKIYRMMVNLGLSRLYDPFLTPLKPSFPADILAELQYTIDNSYFAAQLAEYEALLPYTNRQRPDDDFGDRPTVVIEAEKTSDPETIPDSLDAEKIAAGWPKLQQDTAALSTRGRLVVIKDADHMSIVYHKTYADQAADLIREVVRETLSPNEL